MAALVAMHAVGLAATGGLSGSVRDRITNLAIAGAVVTWVERGVSDTTNAEGRFGFSSASALAPKGASAVIDPSPYRLGQGIVLTQGSAGQVRMDLLDPVGQAIATPHDAFLGAGSWYLPFHSVSQGMYLCRISSGGKAHAFPIVMTGNARIKVSG
jgi:hypothetical protein